MRPDRVHAFSASAACAVSCPTPRGTAIGYLCGTHQTPRTPGPQRRRAPASVQPADGWLQLSTRVVPRPARRPAVAAATGGQRTKPAASPPQAASSRVATVSDFAAMACGASRRAALALYPAVSSGGKKQRGIYKKRAAMVAIPADSARYLFTRYQRGFGIGIVFQIEIGPTESDLW